MRNANAAAPAPSPAARAELTPTGVLRVGINYGNTVLVQRDAAGGEPRGVAPELARELARRLNAPIRYVAYDTAGKMADAVKADAWDVAFLGVDPGRAADIAFTAPYVEFEGTYLVTDDSPLRRVEDVDRAGVRIAVGAKSAYDLFLTRAIRHATLERLPTSDDAIALFLARKIDVVAGIKAPLAAVARKHAGLRVIEPGFMIIRQGAGVPRQRAAAARYLTQFIEDAKASGFVARALAHSGATDATVAKSSP